MYEATAGITILKRYGPFKNACWVLHHNSEAAVVEMPPYHRGREKPPYDKLEVFLKKRKLYLKYGFLSHPHWDHCNTLPRFRAKFPQTYFVTHSSFMEDSYFKFVLQNVRSIWGRKRFMGSKRFFDVVFSGDIWTGNIGGEPVYLIHAPKHSPGDLLIIFRGAVITGDWYLGDLKDCNNLVSAEQKIRSIDRVIQIVRNLNYNVHMCFSGHGDHLFYNADFFSILQESKIDHGDNYPHIEADLVPIPTRKGKK